MKISHRRALSHEKRAIRHAACVALFVALPCMATGEAPAPWAFTAPRHRAFSDSPPVDMPLDELGLAITPQEQVLQHMREADRFTQDKDWESAAKEIREALRLAPNSPELLSRSGNIHMMLREYAESEKCWAQLADAYPRSAWARACRGGMLLRLGRDKEAEADIQQAIKMDPTEIVARFHLAWLQLKRGEADAAATTLHNLNLLDLGKTATWMSDEADVIADSLGNQYFKKFCEIILTGGDRAEAAWYAEMDELNFAALKNRMTKIAATVSQAYTAMAEKKWDAALPSLKDALRQGGRAPALINDAAFCHFQLGEVDQATSYMERIIKAYPNNPLVLKKYGAFCLEVGNYDKAVSALSQARAIAPDDIDILLNLAGAYAAQTNLTDAWSVLNTVPVERRAAYRKWFDQEKPFIQSLRTNVAYTQWIATPANFRKNAQR